MTDIFDLAKNENFSKLKEVLKNEESLTLVNKKNEKFIHFILIENEDFLAEILVEEEI